MVPVNILHCTVFRHSDLSGILAHSEASSGLCSLLLVKYFFLLVRGGIETARAWS